MAVTISIGERLRAARLQGPFSLAEAARYLRVRKAEMTLWEKGRQLPTEHQIGMLARLAGIAVSSLVGPGMLVRLGLDPALAEIAAATAPVPPRPRSHILGTKGRPPPRLPPARHPKTGRWVSIAGAASAEHASACATGGRKAVPELPGIPNTQLT